MDSKRSKCPMFNGDDYGLWKNKMMHYIKGIDWECWRVIQNGPIVIYTDSTKAKVKDEPDYTETDCKTAEKNSKAISLLQSGISDLEYNRCSTCATAKEIWDNLQLTYEGTSQVKKHRIDLLTQQYEMFSMAKNETIHSMTSRFTTITNELRNLGKTIATEDLVRKILRSLDDKWHAKKTAIEEAKDLSTLSYQELIGSLMAHELSLDKRNTDPPKTHSIALKAEPSDDEIDIDDLSMFAKKFRNALRNKQNNFNFNKNKKPFVPKSNITCFKCGEPGHMIKDCPLWKNIKSKDKRDKTKREYKQVMLASVWGDSLGSDDEETDDDAEANLCLKTFENVNTNRSTVSASHICLMGKSGYGSSDNEEDEVSFSSLKGQVKTLPKSEMIKYFEETLDACQNQSIELEELKRQINEIAEENYLLNKKVKKLSKTQNGSVPNLDVTDQSKIVEELSIENKTLLNKVNTLVQQNKSLTERNDSLMEDKDQLNKKMDDMKSWDESRSLLFTDMIEQNNQLKVDLEKALKIANKWEGSSNALSILKSQTDNTIKLGLGFPLKIRSDRIFKKPEPTERDFRKRKYVNLPEYLTCNFCGRSGHVEYNCDKKVSYVKKNTTYTPRPIGNTNHYNHHYKQSNHNIRNYVPNRKIIRQVWIRKDLLSAMTNRKEPNIFWVPKHKN